MKKKSGFIVMILSICMLVSMWNGEAQAASGSVTISSVSGNVGSTVTVTGTIKASEPISAVTVTLTYNQAGLQYVSGSQDVNGGSGSVVYFGDVMGQNKTSMTFSMQFKILKEGSFGISGNTDGYTEDMDSINMTVSKGTVTGKAVSSGNSGGSNGGGGNTGSNNGGGSTGGSNSGGNSGTGGTTTGNQKPEEKKDSNSKLSSLKVYPGSMTPAFNADTTSYTVNVTEDITEVTISAATQSGKASVSTSGGKELKLGPNEAKVVVVAEDGTTTVYDITIMCGELEKININDKQFLIDESFTDDMIPSGFVHEKVTYNEREYEALSHEKGNMKLMSLKNDETGSEFYIYDQETQSFYPFVMIQIAEGKFIIPSQLFETSAFAETLKLTVQSKEIDAWKIDNQFSVINAMTMDGEEILYKYDQVDGTYQRYSEVVPEEAEIVEEEKSFLDQYGLYIIIGLSAVVVVLSIALIYFVATRNHRHNSRRRRRQKKLETK